MQAEPGGRQSQGEHGQAEAGERRSGHGRQGAGVYREARARQLRAEERLVYHQTYSGPVLDALLAAPDQRSWSGRRDHALLLTMYNTGARVSEIVALEQAQCRFGVQSFLQLRGKGRKERTIPLWTTTARTLQAWFRELAGQHTPLAFPSTRGKQLTRNGVDYLLQQAVAQAVSSCPVLREKTITPHTLRHTTATHLLQAGVDLAVIMNGLEATRHIKARPDAPRVVMLTLHDAPEYRAVAAAVGADDFVSKAEFHAWVLPLIHALRDEKGT